MKEQSKAIQTIITNFKSEKEAVVLEAIKKNRKEGNATSFKALLNLLKDTYEPTIEAAIIEFLYDLKDEESASILMEAVEDKEFVFYQNFLVAAFWQSALDGSAYLSNFVNVAIHGEYMTTLEALTVIENFDSAFSQDELTELDADLLEAIEEEQNEDKKLLLISMADVVRNLPLEGE